MPEPDTSVVAQLVEVLALGWLRRRGGPAAAPAPPGAAGLYRRLLALAARRGVALFPAHTPYERARSLRRELPSAPVDELTALLVAEVYAGVATREEDLARVRRDLARAEASDSR